MTAYFDMAAANRVLAEHWVPIVDQYDRELQELNRRMEAIGPKPPWWRPILRRRWLRAFSNIYNGWCIWCLSGVSRFKP